MILVLIAAISSVEKAVAMSSVDIAANCRRSGHRSGRWLSLDLVGGHGADLRVVQSGNLEPTTAARRCRPRAATSSVDRAAIWPDFQGADLIAGQNRDVVGRQRGDLAGAEERDLPDVRAAYLLAAESVDIVGGQTGKRLARSPRSHRSRRTRASSVDRTESWAEFIEPI